MKIPSSYKPSILAVLASAAFAAPASAQTGPDPIVGEPGVESDGDGVNDDIDAEPCNSLISTKAFVPADRTWGMLMFEDKWPSQGDFDFNDLVLAYNQTLSYDSAAQLTALRMDLRVMAVGARFTNGLAIHLPGVAKGKVVSMALTIGNQGTNVSLRAADTDAVITLTSDLHALFNVPAGTWVNTDPTGGTDGYVDIVLEVLLAPGHTLDTADSPFDIFLFNATRGTEVHRPQFRGTAALDATLVNSADDATTPARAFVTTGGIPFVLHIPETAVYPKEGVSIDQLFPEIVTFGQSAGTQATNFYRNPASGFAFGNVSPGAFPTATNADTSCFTPNPGICGSAAGTGLVNAPTTNLCSSGTASAVTSGGSFHQWTCAGNYSLDTACDAPDYVCGPNLTSDCSGSITNGSGIQTCNGSGTGYGTCQLTACNVGFYQSGPNCIAQACQPGSQQSCSIAGGTGIQTCDSLGSQFFACQVQSCNSGFSLVSGTCQATSGADVYYQCTDPLTTGYVVFVENINSLAVNGFADQLTACQHYGFKGLTSGSSSQYGQGPANFGATSNLVKAVNCHNCFNSDGGNPWYYNKQSSVNQECQHVSGSAPNATNKIMSAYVFNVDDSNLDCMTFKQALGSATAFGDNKTSDANDPFYYANYAGAGNDPFCNRARVGKQQVRYTGTPDYILCASNNIQ